MVTKTRIAMDSKQGIVAEAKGFRDLLTSKLVIRARLEGEDPPWWYSIYGPTPAVGEVVKVVMSIGDDPYIDTSVRWPV
jgi:hypothetical protein